MSQAPAQIDHRAYQTKCKRLSSDSLRYIINDCQEALAANPEGHKAGYYADEINYCSMELSARKRAGK
jgi:hypothetical protein